MSEIVGKKLNINSAGEHGFNLLYWALKSDSSKSFERLLLLGADSDNIWGEAYSSTCWLASLDTDKYLKMALKYRANPTVSNPNTDDTPIFNSLSADNAKNLQLIIDAKADVNYKISMTIHLDAGCELVKV